MQTKNLSDKKLHALLLRNVQSERVLLTEILHQLREVEKRRLFSDFKCSSTFDYTVKILGYSEPQAGRRIQAMRLMRDIPEVEEKLTTGELTLTTAAQVQQFINKEERAARAQARDFKEAAKNIARSENGERKKINSGEMNSGDQKKLSKVGEVRFDAGKKKKVIEKVSGLSSRKAEQVLLSEATVPEAHKEKTRKVAQDRLELKFSISPEAQEKMQKLKGLLAHAKGNMSLEVFFSEVLELANKQIETQKGLKLKKSKNVTTAVKESLGKATTKSRRGASKGAVEMKKIAGNDIQKTKNEMEEVAVKSKIANVVEKSGDLKNFERRPLPRKSVPRKSRREVWRKFKERCENCGSTYALEIEHCKPVAKGGDNGLKNLKQLCRNCNQRAAIKEYGGVKMNNFLRNPEGIYGSASVRIEKGEKLSTDVSFFQVSSNSRSNCSQITQRNFAKSSIR